MYLFNTSLTLNRVSYPNRGTFWGRKGSSPIQPVMHFDPKAATGYLVHSFPECITGIEYKKGALFKGEGKRAPSIFKPLFPNGSLKIEGLKIKKPYVIQLKAG